MAQHNKRKGVSYYFRIEFSTLQGKITSGFCFLAVLAVILMMAASWMIYPALTKSQYRSQVLQLSENQLLLLSAHLENTTALTREKIQASSSMEPQELELHSNRLMRHIDSLQVLSTQWKMKDAQLSLQLAAAKTGTYLEKLETLYHQRETAAQLHLLDKDLLPLQQQIEEQIAKIRQHQRSEQTAIQKFIDFRTDNLGWLLFGSLLASIALGGSIASYIVLQILKEIRMLKHKILELSEGKLITPIPESRNELNSIIKAINTLVENLQNIRRFAQEVGKGNFDTNISVFDGENDLGESLAGMRESLKMVAQEEKQRSWVTGGLAQFSDILRNSSEDLTTYYQKIISELVRYLNVNQAAIYIAENNSGNRTMLELKAAYAYGRLKHEQKVLAPGQGMAGQVFLEKEPLFLKNIPGNYLQISSGLGDASPNYLALIPLKVNNDVNGVLELASFQELAPYQVEFLLQLAEDISGALHNVTNIQTTARLLQEAQAMAQAMQSQEEMLRQNSEELIATQEKLSRDLQEMEIQHQFYTQALQLGAFPCLLVNAAGKIEVANQQARNFLGQSVTELSISSFLQHQELENLLALGTAAENRRFTADIPNKGTVIVHASCFAVGSRGYVHLQLISEETFQTV